MIIDNKLLDNLSAQAGLNPRLRQAYDLRTTSEDQSQRILNALEPGTILPIHRHRHTAETMIVIRGSVKELLYDDNGNLTNEYIMTPQGEYPMIQIETGQWHSLEVVEDGTVIFEAKDGAYEPLTDEDILTI